MNYASDDSDPVVIEIEEGEHDEDFSGDDLHYTHTDTMTADSNPSAITSSTRSAVTNSTADASNTFNASINNPAAAGSTPTANTPIILANVPRPPINISLWPRHQNAGATADLTPTSLGQHAAINPTTLNEALSDSTTSRPKVVAVKKPAGKQEYRGRTACDRCHEPRKMTCVLQPGNSTCDSCEKRGLPCSWTWAGTPGEKHHQERFGHVPLSGPWVDLWLNGSTAPFAANGGDALNEHGSGADAPLPHAFYYLPAEEENDDEGDEAEEGDVTEEVDIDEEDEEDEEEEP